MFCKNCGAQINDNAKFCPNCGTSIPASAQQSPQEGTVNQPAQPQVQQRQAAPAPAPTPANSQSYYQPAANYQAPQQAYAQPQYVPAPSTNGLCIAGLILAFVFPLLGLILSIVGLVKVKSSGEGGRGLAIAGIILTELEFFVYVCIILFYLIIALCGDVRKPM